MPTMYYRRVRQILTSKGYYVAEISAGGFEGDGIERINHPKLVLDIIRDRFNTDNIYGCPYWKVTDSKDLVIDGVPVIRCTWSGAIPTKHKGTPLLLKEDFEKCENALYQWALKMPVIGPGTNLNYSSDGLLLRK